MLKTALCISVLLVAANVCYGHGYTTADGVKKCADGSKGRITHFVPGEERISDRVESTATYPGGHGHHKAYPAERNRGVIGPKKTMRMFWNNTPMVRGMN